MTTAKLLKYLRRKDVAVTREQNKYDGNTSVYEYSVLVGQRRALHAVEDWIRRQQKRGRKQ